MCVYQASPSAASPGFCRATWHKRRGGKERRGGQGMENVRRNVGEGVGLNLNHRKKMSHRELSPSSFFYFHSCPVSSCEGWCWEELQECCWGFPNFCYGVRQGYTLARTHIDNCRPVAMHGGLSLSHTHTGYWMTSGCQFRVCF